MKASSGMYISGGRSYYYTSGGRSYYTSGGRPKLVTYFDKIPRAIARPIRRALLLCVALDSIQRQSKLDLQSNQWPPKIDLQGRSLQI